MGHGVQAVGSSGIARHKDQLIFARSCFAPSQKVRRLRRLAILIRSKECDIQVISRKFKIIWVAAKKRDLFLVVGSSLQVNPAATLPILAKRSGAALAIINRDPTPLDDLADVVLRRPIGAVFSTLYPQIVSETFSSL